MNKELAENPEIFFERLNKSERILIISHINPDGDSIGSLLGLGLALRKVYGKKIKMIFSDEMPQKFRFLPGIEFAEKNFQVQNIDTLITLDCSDLNRLGKYKYLAQMADHIINIDHHISNINYGDMNIVDPNASSTGEIIFNVLSKAGIKINKDIATCLYVAISTDTGSFKYDNTSENTHLIAAKLINLGINLNDVVVEVYQNRPLNKTKLFIECLKNLELFEQNTLAIVTVDKKSIDMTNSKIEDIDGIVEFVRDIDTVEVACILKEVGNKEIKIGLRSKKHIDVAAIAENFKGGGHKRAAGCTIYTDLNNAKQQIKEEIFKNIR